MSSSFLCTASIKNLTNDASYSLFIVLNHQLTGNTLYVLSTTGVLSSVIVCRMGVDVMILPKLAAEENPAELKRKVGDKRT
jgi:hypothetical protein